MFKLTFNASLHKRLGKLPKRDVEHLWKKIACLKEDPRPRWAEKLKARPGFRIAVGNYRIIYSIDEDRKIVTIIEINDRKDVYRKY